MSRANVFMMSLTRAAIFGGTALAVGILLHSIALDIVRSAAPVELKGPLVMFAALLFTIGLTSTGGAAIGFHWLPHERRISSVAVIALGALFGAIGFLLFVPVLKMAGVYWGGCVYVMLAALIAFTGGRILSRVEAVE